jgi:hypothetical protein
VAKKTQKLKEAFSSGGAVHPIRGSAGYSPKKAGEKAPPSHKKK